MITAEFTTRSREIEDLVAADDLNEATKRLMDFVTDYSTDRERRREVVAIRRNYSAIRNDLRTDGKTDTNLRRLAALTDQILEFVDLIHDDRIAQRNVQGNPPPAARPATANTIAAMPAAVKPGASLRHRLLPASAPAGNDLGAIAFEGTGLTTTHRAGSRVFTLQPIDLVLRAGEITVLVGENGNGKTTLLNIVSGLIQADGGSVSYPLLARDGADPYTIRGRIGFMPQTLFAWSGRVADNLHFTAGSRGLRGSRNEDEVEFILYRLGLERYGAATWSELSGGYRTRFELARILLSDPRLLVLDEPLANLDVNTQLLFLNDLRQLVRSPSHPMAAVISSQHLHEVEAVADHIVFLKNGEAAYNGSMAAFGEDRDENCYELACSATRDQIFELLEPLACTRVTMAGHNFVVHTARGVTKEAFLGALLGSNVSIEYFRDISKSTRKLFEADP